MVSYKTRGIILKAKDFGEADKLLTIYSEDRGKIKAIAKGLKRIKSKFGGRLEPLSFVQLMFSTGRNLDIVTGAETIFSFPEIRNNYKRLTCGLGMLEFMEKITALQVKEAKLFYLLLSALELLGKETFNFSLLLTAFDLKLIALSGYLPHLNSCLICNYKGAELKFYFCLEQGGILCERCAPQNLNAILLSPGALKFLREILKKDLEQVVKMEILEETVKEALKLLSTYIDFWLGARLKSRQYLP